MATLRSGRSLAVHCATALLSLGLPQLTQAQIVSLQTDDFQAGLDNWQSGANNPVPPTQVLNVGPTGAGDNAMRLTANGGTGPGSALVAFNLNQWHGNYTAIGVTSVTLDLNNTGSSSLTMRLAFESNGGSWFVSTAGYNLPAGSGWQTAHFSLAPTDLTEVSGNESYASVFTSVKEMRLLNSAAPAFSGDRAAGAVLVDNITAVPEPAATMFFLGLSGVAVSTWLRSRRAAM